MTEPRRPPPSPEHALCEQCKLTLGCEHGAPKLDDLDAPFERVYRLADSHTTTLFLALCRSQGFLPYRRPRQHDGTICLRASLSQHDALWTSFEDLSRQLHGKLAEVTQAFVQAHAPRKSAE
jgi:hypothetical protein